MSSQNKNGKAFEYALAISYYNHITKYTKVDLVENKALEVAKSKFDLVDQPVKARMLAAANVSLKFILDIEPRLLHSLGNKDVLQVELAEDRAGQDGDVRDIIFIRSAPKWEIGFSAKNNHRALKHSRLSHVLDFGKQWINKPCSDEYWKNISIVFDKVKAIKEIDANTKWKDAFPDIYKEIYTPLLNAWKKEVLKMYDADREKFCQKFVHYLIGF